MSNGIKWNQVQIQFWVLSAELQIIGTVEGTLLDDINLSEHRFPWKWYSRKTEAVIEEICAPHYLPGWRSVRRKRTVWDLYASPFMVNTLG
uniref:Uncharacterized protein n=1 Tax=Rhodnius prolixus TaxID=13249 RepID=T1HQ38_RHOPR